MVQLFCSDDTEKVLGTKSFFWPEQKFPEEVIFLFLNGVFCFIIIVINNIKEFHYYLLFLANF